jgi:hypothetical protein
MKAHEVLFGARQYLAGLGVAVAADEQVWPDLQEEDVRVLDEIVGIVGNASYPLPGDQWQGADVDGVATPWVLPADFWRLRRATLSYSDTTPTKIVRLVSEDSGRLTPPQVQPSAYIFRAGLTGIGATEADAEDRKWGWLNGERICLLYVETPTAVDGPDDVLNSPDDAKKYLMRALARRLVGRVPDVGPDLLRIVDGEVKAAKNELLEAVARYGKTGYGA